MNQRPPSFRFSKSEEWLAVRFVRPPKEESYGTAAVFEDLYGNLWDLLQLSDEVRFNPIKAEE